MVWISRAKQVGTYIFSYALWARNLNYLNYIVCPLIGLDSLDFSSEASRMFYFSYALWARNLNYLNYIVCPLIGLDGLDFASEASRRFYFSYALWARNLNYLNYAQLVYILLFHTGNMPSAKSSSPKFINHP